MLGFSFSAIGKTNMAKSSSLAGRSYQELKEMTHIDNLSTNDKLSKQSLLQHNRKEAIERQQNKIQQRIDLFYKKLEALEIETKGKDKNKHAWMVDTKLF